MDELIVAIVGRPNVGKSTLFNRLVGKKHAIVDDQPGVTRDWREGQATLSSLNFKIIDTAGLETLARDELSKKIKQVTISALDRANIILFVVDAKVGVTDEEQQLISWLRKFTKKIILVGNKAESSNTAVFFQDYYKLGLGEPVFIAAEHGLGMVDLFEALDKEFQALEINATKNTEKQEAVAIAIVGRPNAGKSTLVNQLLKSERMITGETPGITRDSIALDYEFNGKKIKLIDTAGIKKKNSIKSELEELTYEDSKRAIRFAHVVILVMDATIAFEAQDVAIANIAIAEGRPLVVAINKWDKVQDKSKYNNALHDSINRLIPEIKDVSVIYISAINGHNVNLMMKAALESYDNWNIRIPTRQLNNWLKEKISVHPIPLGSRERKVKIKYITQHNIRPPAFVLFSNLPDSISNTYIRYLANHLKEDFNLKGVPVRLHLKKSDNPYESN